MKEFSFSFFFFSFFLCACFSGPFFQKKKKEEEEEGEKKKSILHFFSIHKRETPGGIYTHIDIYMFLRLCDFSMIIV